MVHIRNGVLTLVALILLGPSQSNAHVLLCEEQPKIWVECEHGHFGGGGNDVSRTSGPGKPGNPPTSKPPEPPNEPPNEPPTINAHHNPPGKGKGHDNHDWDHKGKGHNKETGIGHGTTGKD